MPIANAIGDTAKRASAHGRAIVKPIDRHPVWADKAYGIGT